MIYCLHYFFPSGNSAAVGGAVAGVLILILIVVGVSVLVLVLVLRNRKSSNVDFKPTPSSKARYEIKCNIR